MAAASDEVGDAKSYNKTQWIASEMKEKFTEFTRVEDIRVREGGLEQS